MADSMTTTTTNHNIFIAFIFYDGYYMTLHGFMTTLLRNVLIGTKDRMEGAGIVGTL